MADEQQTQQTSDPDTALARLNTDELNQLGPYVPQTFMEAWRLARIVAQSRLVPGITTASAAYMVMATGSDLGLTFAQAVRGIKPIEGQIGMLSALKMALVRRRKDVCEYIEVEEMTAKRCVVLAKRVGGRKEHRYEYTIEEAKDAGLLDRGQNPKMNNWNRHPKMMLFRRAVSIACEVEFGELLFNLPDPDEIEAEPIVDDASRIDRSLRSKVITVLDEPPRATPETMAGPAVVVGVAEVVAEREDTKPTERMDLDAAIDQLGNAMAKALLGKRFRATKDVAPEMASDMVWVTVDIDRSASAAEPRLTLVEAGGSASTTLPARTHLQGVQYALVETGTNVCGAAGPPAHWCCLDKGHAGLHTDCQGDGVQWPGEPEKPSGPVDPEPQPAPAAQPPKAPPPDWRTAMANASTLIELDTICRAAIDAEVPKKDIQPVYKSNKKRLQSKGTPQ